MDANDLKGKLEGFRVRSNKIAQAEAKAEAQLEQTKTALAEIDQELLKLGVEPDALPEAIAAQEESLEKGSAKIEELLTEGEKIVTEVEA